MSEKGATTLIKAAATLATFLVATALYFLLAWLLILVGVPAALGWLVAILYPVIVGATYVVALRTSLGKYLFTLPPGSLG